MKKRKDQAKCKTITSKCRTYSTICKWLMIMSCIYRETHIRYFTTKTRQVNLMTKNVTLRKTLIEATKVYPQTLNFSVQNPKFYNKQVTQRVLIKGQWDPKNGTTEMALLNEISTYDDTNDGQMDTFSFYVNLNIAADQKVKPSNLRPTC